jgi:hypothetical protein
VEDVDSLRSLHEAWGKCCFCGARNGLFGRPLQQHRPRCRYKGPADSFEVTVPSYGVMIEEDDPHFLSMMHAEAELPILRAHIQRLKVSLAECQDKKPSGG